MECCIGDFMAFTTFDFLMRTNPLLFRGLDGLASMITVGEGGQYHNGFAREVLDES